MVGQNRTCVNSQVYLESRHKTTIPITLKRHKSELEEQAQYGTSNNSQRSVGYCGLFQVHSRLNGWKLIVVLAIAANKGDWCREASRSWRPLDPHSHPHLPAQWQQIQSALEGSFKGEVRLGPPWCCEQKQTVLEYHWLMVCDGMWEQSLLCHWRSLGTTLHCFTLKCMQTISTFCEATSRIPPKCKWDYEEYIVDRRRIYLLKKHKQLKEPNTGGRRKRVEC